MEMNTIIELQAFGDFGVKYTDCIMVHSDIIDKSKIMSEFYQIKNIKSNTGLDFITLQTISDDFISFLETKGFVKLNTQKIYFCD